MSPDHTDTPKRSPFERKPIVISAERIRLLQADFGRQWKVMPTKPQLAALIQETVENEILYREAKVLALDFKDRSIQRRLIQKMQALNTTKGRTPNELYREALSLGLDNDIVIRRLLIEKMRILLQQFPPDRALQEERVRAYIEQNRERFLQPATLSFSHIFLSENRGDNVAGQARKLLAQLRTGRSTDRQLGLWSDPFPLGLRFRSYPRTRIAARFGNEFAERVFAMDTGIWLGPVESAYGLHLVRVDAKQAAKLPPLEVVWSKAASEVAKQHRTRRLGEAMSHLRSLYEIRVESSEAAAEIGASRRQSP